MPLAVKELTAMAGQQHTMASTLLRENVAGATDPCLIGLLEAGAIPFARTNTPEFGCASVTDNLLYGQTLNPWDPAYAPAGSSGGAAAALATFATPLAQATDSAGSLRMPAAACGVVGFKPSHGVVPSSAPDYLDTIAHNGPMARTVGDVALMLEHMARPDPGHLAGRVPLPATSTELDGLRVALITGMAGLDTDHDVAAGLRDTAELLAAAGARVQEADFPWDWDRLFRAVRLSFGAIYAPMARMAIDAGAEVSDLTQAFVASVAEVASGYDFTVQARREQAELHAGLGAIFATADVLLLPTLQMPAPVADDHFLEHGPMVNGVEQADRWIVAFTVPFNLTSGCPAISLPTGLSRDGLPTAAQFVAAPYRDRDLLRWAAQAEYLIGDGVDRSRDT
jgi:Asp-tRNA(Asn)/Glu-tRNA(Gln) amidotransferase A subunit family amidase